MKVLRRCERARGRALGASIAERSNALTSAFETENTMDNVLTLRPFVPARDYALSKRFYERLGFRLTRADEQIAFFKIGAFSFVLQNFYEAAFAGNFVMQLMLRDVDSWWNEARPASLAEEFGVRAPKPPEMQPWGLRVGFITDPSGVLWHVAEALF
jgi:uncharacterized glyoxalase superfamily protein PhnB